MQPANYRKIILLDDGRRGHLQQTQALLDALRRQSDVLAALPVQIVRLSLTAWQQNLIASIARYADRQMNALDSAALPGLVIGAGRRCAAYSRLVKQYYPACFTVQILDPGRARGEYSVLLVPAHDQVAADNVIQFQGSLANPGIPAEAAVSRDTENVWPTANRCKLALLLAGRPAQNKRLLHQARQQVAGGKLQCMISLAPRTATSLAASIQRDWQGLPGRILTVESGPTGYWQMLNSAEQFWVAADSINQVSEVLSVRGARPVWVDPVTGSRRKQRWITALLANDEVRLVRDYPQLPSALAIARSSQFWRQQLKQVAEQVIQRALAKHAMPHRVDL